MRTSDTH